MIKINQGYWFPLIGRIVGFIFLVVIVLSFAVPADSLGVYVIRIIPLVFCIIAVTSRNFLVLSMQDNTYWEYRWVLGFKFGKKEKFDSIEKLFINKIKLVADVYKYSPVVVPNSSEVRSSLYKCFIKFGNGEKMLLDSDEDKDKLINRLKEYNKVLKTTLYDTTSHETLVIE
jgi:hypothetical protein